MSHACGGIGRAAAGQLAVVLAAQRHLGQVTYVWTCRAVGFCDAAGTGVLVQEQCEFLAARGTLTLVGVGPRLAHLLAITGLGWELLTCPPPATAPVEAITRPARPNQECGVYRCAV